MPPQPSQSNACSSLGENQEEFRFSQKFFGIAISGVAGPQESENKPVGNVFIGIIGSFCNLLLIKEYHFGKIERTEIQKKTVQEALSLCLQHTELIK